ncbi:MAG: DUF2314 domain-containing protein [Hyphomonadaceae bacterium]
MKNAFAVLFATFALALCAPLALAQDGKPDENSVAWVREEDAEMNAAIASARAALPACWAAREAQRGQGFMVKAALRTTTGGIEHIWVDNLRRENSRVTGNLANEPLDLAGMTRGSEVTFGEEEISDWVVFREGRVYGDYTTRVLFVRMSDDERARYLPYINALSDGLP